VPQQLRWRLSLTRSVRHALPIVMLALTVAPSFAQSLVCHPIRRGESAGQAARRVTGNSQTMYSASFQIMNASSRFVPKSQYDRRLPAGSRACVIERPARMTVARRRSAPPAAFQTTAAPVPAAPPTAVAGPEPVAHFRVSAQPAASVAPGPIARVNLGAVWLGAAIVVPWVAFRIVSGHAVRRKAASVRRQQFADRFIAEFERPLVLHDGTGPPVQTRVRRARRGRFDVLLAPGQGRRYPNLTDHKRNVEYDVDRVVSALADPAFAHGPLHAEAEWVVVPFEPRTPPTQPGVPCRSSS
jgi:hypothetical protein